MEAQVQLILNLNGTQTVLSASNRSSDERYALHPGGLEKPLPFGALAQRGMRDAAWRRNLYVPSHAENQTGGR